jgi:hypothetical protein
MTSYFWVCRTGCWWKKSADFSDSIRAHGLRGRVRDFDPLTATPILLGAQDAFCAEGLGKDELRGDLLTGLDLRPNPADGSSGLYVWGHHSGPLGLVYLVVVSDRSGLHNNPTVRPESWKLRMGPSRSLSSHDLGNAVG